jgi:hypothetical protein
MADAVSVGLFFDDPKKSAGPPRWAAGWLVEASSFEQIQELVDDVKKASGLEGPIRAVRISKDNILKAEIPWRTRLTPMIAPMLHWDRGFRVLQEEYESKKKSEYNPIALEVYVRGATGGSCFDRIDYVVLFGDTSHTWADTFPDEKSPSSEDARTSEQAL